MDGNGHCRCISIRIRDVYAYNNTTAVEERYNTNTYLKNGVVRA